MALAAFLFGAILDPGGVIAWLLIGLIAGAISGTVMRGSGFGLLSDIIVGLIGALLGGLLMNLLAPNAIFGFWGSLIVAIIGACILLALLRAFKDSRRAL
uniref:Transglycosylase n=1 Tax=Thermosporothrix sp. COM3 TaxID=2490863 RepID=A0A455SCK3_9CHLR|nr:hypothetical protein KTC_09280 [Thermosporothrix sp. COM3]